MSEQLEATGWEEVFSEEHQDHYWANRCTGQATWERPLTETAAVPIALTGSTPEQSVRGGGTSDSDANSMPAVPWQTQDPVFLPEYFSGHRVIHVTQSERWFLIDDKKKLKDIGGLRYRPSRNLDESAEDLHEHGANWGDLVEGELKDGWLKTTFYTERKIHIVVQREVQSGEIDIIVSLPFDEAQGLEVLDMRGSLLAKHNSRFSSLRPPFCDQRLCKGDIIENVNGEIKPAEMWVLLNSDMRLHMRVRRTKRHAASLG